MSKVKFQVIGSCSVGIGLCLFLIGCSKSIESPRIQFNEREYNFGDLAQVDQVTHIFKFKNVGGDTLIINNVRAP